MKKVLKYSLRTLLILLLVAVILFISAFFLIQQPKIQTWAVHKVATYLSNKIGSEVKVGAIDIKFFKTIQINDVFVAGPKKDTIMYAHELDVTLKYFDPFKRIFHFDDISLDGLVMYGKRDINDSTYNFSYIFKAFASQKEKVKDTATQKDPILITLNDIQITNTHLVLDDRYKDMKLELRSKKVYIDVDKFDINKLLIKADNIELDTPEFTFTFYNQKQKIKDTIPGKPFRPQNMGLDLEVASLVMKNGMYAMNMENRDIRAGDFQINKMRIRNINIDVEDFTWDTLGMKVHVNELNTDLDNNIHIKKIAGNVLLDNKQIKWDKANIAYNDTKLTGDLGISFPNDWHDIVSFVSEVNMKADVKIQARGKDVTLFSPVADKYVPDDASLDAVIRGRLNNLRIEKLIVNSGKNTVVDLSGNIKGLPKVDQTLFDLKINQVKTNSTEIKQLVSFMKMPKQLDQAGNISFSGTYFGFFNDFVARGKLVTSNLGSAETDIRMSFKKGQVPTYDGIIKGQNINLAILTGNSKLFRTADLDLDAKGEGFDLKTLYTAINGTISNFYMNGFVFDKIDVTGLLDKKKYSGKAFFDDSCFLVDFNGIADFNDSVPKFDFEASLKNIDLHKLNFTKDTIIISLDGEVHMTGNNINNISGTGDFSNIIIQNAKNMMGLSNVDADFANDGKVKNYTIKSNEIDVNLKGEFNPLTLYQSSKVFVSQYTNLYKPTSKDLSSNQPQQIDAKIILHTDVGGLVKVFTPKLNYLSELNLDAQLNTQTGLLKINTMADSFNYDGIAISGIQINSQAENKNLLGTLQVRELLYDKVKVNDIALGFNSSSEQLLSNLSIENDSARNALRLESAINFNGNSIYARILDSKLRLNHKDWIVEPGNSITIVDDVFTTENFNLKQGDQRISLQNGRNTLSDVKINVENLLLADIAQIMDTTGIVKSGSLTGMINLKNILTKLEANADVVIKNLKVLDYDIDYIGLDGVYGRNGKKYAEVGGTMEDDEYQLSFDGTYDMSVKGKEKLEASADIQRLSLQFLQDLLKKEIIVEKAFVKGQVKATGTLKNINLEGSATFLDTARIKMRFLGTMFNIPAGEEVIMDNKGFDFGTMTLFDDYGNSALLSGRLNHDAFNNFAVDNVVLNASSGFNFMNTTFDDNQSFYGVVFARGNVLLDGPFTSLNIIIDAQTMKNTVFNLPITGGSSAKGYSFIKFFNPRDSTYKEVTEKTGFTGLNILMNIDANPNAEVNIILDPSSNDKISGTGEGSITMKMDPKGELSLNGEYTLHHGTYNFRFQNVIDKTFTVRRGSSIYFSGDPLKAELDINAVYTLKSVSLRNIDSTLKNTIPVDLNLNVGGTLESPKITFSITSTSSGNISATNDKVQTLLTQISNDQNEVNNQAFSLLLFNTFSQRGQIASTGSYSNSITQFVSNQISQALNNQIGRFIPGARVDVLFSDLENKDSRQFGFNYSQQLFNNRLIFTVGGNVNFGSNTNVTPLNDKGNTAFAGDFVLEYLLTADGRIRLKTFARTANYDLINQDRIRTGGAIAFQKDFDKIGDFFSREDKKKKAVIVPVQDSTGIEFVPVAPN